MAVNNYTLETFLATPSAEDTKLRIYDRNRILKYTMSPELSYFFVKNNLVIIKQENQADVILNFEDSSVAIKALSKLNAAKKTISENILPVPSTGEITFSTINLNMPALVTNSDGDLACNTPVGELPTSNIRVFINGVEVNVGATMDCFFSPDGGVMKRPINGATIGDLLYWNGNVADYQLDTIDSIDFVYLVKK